MTEKQNKLFEVEKVDTIIDTTYIDIRLRTELPINKDTLKFKEEITIKLKGLINEIENAYNVIDTNFSVY